MQELEHSRAKIRIMLFLVQGLIRHLWYTLPDGILIKVPRERIELLYTFLYDVVDIYITRSLS